MFGEVLYLDHATSAEYECVFDDVFELPHIPGEIVPHENRHDIGRDTRYPLVFQTIKLINTVANEKGNILLPPS